MVGLTRAGLAPALTAVDLTRAARGLAPTVDDLTQAELGWVPIVAYLTLAELGWVPIVTDLTLAATSQVLADRTRGRVMVDPAVIMPPAALTAVHLTFIAMAPKPHLGRRIFITTISMSLHLLSRVSRVSRLAAGNLTLTQRISTPRRRDLTRISSLTTVTAMRPLLILRIPTPITTRRTLTARTLTPATIRPTLTTKVLVPATTRRTLTTKTTTRATTRPTLTTPTPGLVRRIRVLVGLHPPLGAEARGALMPKASASRRFCRARVSRHVARQKIGFALAASPSTANPPCSARACRTPIKYAWMAA